MKKFLFLLAACVLMSQGVDAKCITADQAKAIAQQFTSTQTMFKSSNAQLRLNHVAMGQKGTSDFYVFNRDGGNGFVIVAGDDLSTPILGYSDKGAFDMNTAPEALQEMFKAYQNHLEWLRHNPDAAHKAPRLNYDLQPYGVYPICGEVHWHQFPPYNNNVPRSSKALTSNGRCYAGCVPVAFATIMKGLRYPSRGSGSNSYSFMLDGNETTVSANFADYSYNYSNMRNGYGENASNARDVSELMYEVGVAFNTIYSGESSDALLRNVFKGIIAYFNYNPDIQYVQKSSYSYNEQAWYDMMYNEIDNGRPIYYMGYRTIDNSGNSCNIGHAYVLDGYDSNGKVHVNWGFQPEAYNTYFDWSLLSPRSDYDYDPYASGFNARQAAIIGLCADTTDRGGVVVNNVNLVAETMPANDVRASIDVQALSGKWSGSLRYGIVSKSSDGSYSTVYNFTTDVELEDNEIANIDLSGAYPYLQEGKTYYIVVWTPYFANSFDWMWFLNEPVPFTIGAWENPPVDPIMGDVDEDGSVTIADVTALIDYLLSGDATGINLELGDVDGDGIVTIGDVTAIIDMLVQPNEGDE